MGFALYQNLLENHSIKQKKTHKAPLKASEDRIIQP